LALDTRTIPALTVIVSAWISDVQHVVTPQGAWSVVSIIAGVVVKRKAPMDILSYEDVIDKCAAAEL